VIANRNSREWKSGDGKRLNPMMIDQRKITTSEIRRMRM
jgi:hypothetical protein